MLNRHRADITRCPQEQPLQMCICTPVLHCIVSHESSDYPETGCLQILRLLQKNPDRHIVDITSEITELTVLLMLIISIYNIISLISKRGSRKRNKCITESWSEKFISTLKKVIYEVAFTLTKRVNVAFLLSKSCIKCYTKDNRCLIGIINRYFIPWQTSGL